MDLAKQKYRDHKKHILWYKKPAKTWETEVLPVGNAHLGITISGGVKTETLVLNEKTLWIGGPSKNRPDYRGGNKDHNPFQYVSEIRKALAEKNNHKAVSFVQELTGDCDGYGAYQCLGNLTLDFEEIKEADTSDYKRYLDIDHSLAGVEFVNNKIIYTREYFANYPNNVIAARFTADKKESISFTAGLIHTQEGAVITTSENTLTCSGELIDNGLRYEGSFHFDVKGGEVIPAGDRIIIKKADEVILYYTAATDYENAYPTYRSGIRPGELTQNRRKAALEKGYEKLKEEHITDYRNLFDRTEVSLGGSFPEIPTDVLVKEYISREALDEYNVNDKYLEELYFQFGRYLLISSSREGTLPANLQGVWNESNNPPWACDYHINVNLQMNYWPAFVTNLAETAKPLVEYIDSLREPGRITAKEYYGIVTDEEHPENGWIAHTQSTPFGWTCPGWDFYWGWSSAACAWLDENLWEYYEFTGDKEYLKEAIYPIMRESVRFYIQELIYDSKQDRMVSSPSYSPEHGPVSIGNTYEQSLIEQLFFDFIKASEVLDMDEELRNTVQTLVHQLKPYSVSKTGCLKEWFEEDEADFDWSQVDPHHRHTSHLLGLYPGKGINYDTPDLMEAAKLSLNSRGDDTTGWGMAIKALMWSRTGDGERAYNLLNGLLKRCTNDNLWDICPPFQIDGNFGGTSAIAEMLLQSHMDYISVLPSLPKVWANGSFRGLCARNGFEIDAQWENTKLTQLSILSKNGETCRIKLNGACIISEGGASVDVNENNGIISFRTEKNERYHINLN